jgi:3-hydroxybutyryl-CoA dehydrogenase
MTDKPTIVCLGAGRMGRGMGHVFAYAGYPVTVVDFKDRPAADAKRIEAEVLAEIEANMRFLASLDVMTEAQVGKALSLISVASLEDAAGPLAKADFLLEGVPETVEAKRDAFERACALVPDDTIIASSTSTILVTELQQFVTHPERFMNAHFLNPAYLIPLVEVSPSPDTDEANVQALIDLFEAVGKVPVRCAASPGYIIPRLQSLLLSETARMIHEGVATPEEIDKAIMAGFGPRYATMGAVEFIDWGGVDIVYYAGHYLAKALDSPRHAPPPEVETMMAEGRKGMRERQGYYDFRNVDVDAYVKEKQSRFVALLRFLDKLPPPGV